MNITVFWNVMPVLWEICFDTFFFSGTSCRYCQALWMCDFRLLPRSSWELCSSRLLRHE